MSIGTFSIAYLVLVVYLTLAIGFAFWMRGLPPGRLAVFALLYAAVAISASLALQAAAASSAVSGAEWGYAGSILLNVSGLLAGAMLSAAWFELRQAVRTQK